MEIHGIPLNSMEVFHTGPNRDLLSRNLGIVCLVRRNDKYSYISIFAPISLELLLHCSL